MNKTVKEMVLEYLIQGYTDKEIIETLKISKHTLKSIIAAFKREYMVRNRTYLAYLVGYDRGRIDSKIL